MWEPILMRWMDRWTVEAIYEHYTFWILYGNYITRINYRDQLNLVRRKFLRKNFNIDFSWYLYTMSASDDFMLLGIVAVISNTLKGLEYDDNSCNFIFISYWARLECFTHHFPHVQHTYIRLLMCLSNVLVVLVRSKNLLPINIGVGRPILNKLLKK